MALVATSNNQNRFGSTKPIPISSQLASDGVIGVAISRTKARVKQLLLPHAIPAEQYLLNPPHVLRAWLEIGERALTYSHPRQLAKLLGYVRSFEARAVEGEIIEAGCAWGGSAILMCAAKRRTRPMRVFDVFGMIPPPSANDGADMQRRYAEIAAGQSAGLGGQSYYAYESDLKGKVQQNFADLGYPIESNSVSDCWESSRYASRGRSRVPRPHRRRLVRAGDRLFGEDCSVPRTRRRDRHSCLF